MQKSSGFTLMELMVTIGIIAVASTIAVPNFMAWVPKFRLGSSARDVQSVLQGTRAEAIKDNSTYTVLINVGSDSLLGFLDDGTGTPDTTPADGILDGLGDGILAPTETVIVQRNMADNIDITGTSFAGNLVTFDNQGVASSAGTITLSNNMGGLRRIVLQLAGTSRIIEP